MSDFKTLSESLSVNLYDPQKMQRLVSDKLIADSGATLDVVDPNNPFAWLMEINMAFANANAIGNYATLRKLNPILSENREELYRHMSDKDYIDIFAVPSKANFFINIPFNVMVNNARTIPNSTVKRATIPRYTTFTVDNTNFLLMHDINIDIQSGGGVRVSYDDAVTTPLEVLESNLVDYSVITLGGTKYLVIDAPFTQLKRTIYDDTLGTTFNKTFTLPGQFYYCEVIGKRTDGTTVTFKTTHTEEVYDIREPTALLRVLDGELRVEIPSVYINAGTLPKQIEVIVYTTKGKLAMNLQSYTEDLYTITINSRVTADRLPYVNAFAKNTDVLVYSKTNIDGGSNGLTFEELRSRIIAGLGNQDIPITYAQIKNSLDRAGFNLVVSVDDVMKRIYLATRRIKNSVDSGFSTPAGCTIDQLNITIEQLVSYDTVNDHNTRVTITPDTLFTREGGIAVVNQINRPDYNTSDVDIISSRFNSGRYLYTPFYYVLDTGNSQFDLRAYHLDAPAITQREFIANNDKILETISTNKISVSKVATGYRVLVEAVPNDQMAEIDINNLHAQLVFSPREESVLGYITGNFLGVIGDNYVWEFLINTTYDINSSGHLFLNNIDLPTISDTTVGCLLNQTFDLIYSLDNQSNVSTLRSGIDDYVGSFLLTGETLGVTRERLVLRFGEHLKNLWSNGRAVMSSMVYDTYDTDVPYLWEENIPSRDGNGDIVYTIVNDEVVIQYDHLIGDPVTIYDAGLDEDVVQYKYQVGDVKLDGMGNPILLNDRKTSYICDLLFVDAVYYYATVERDSVYAALISQGIADIVNEIEQLSKPLHENTELYFYPQTTLGDISVIADGGEIKTIDSSLSFKVTVSAPDVTLEDFQLRQSIENTIVDVINTEIAKQRISVDVMQKTMLDLLGDDVYSVIIDKLGDDNDINIMSSVDATNLRSIKRKLVSLPDNSLGIQEDVEIEFKEHS